METRKPFEPTFCLDDTCCRGFFTKSHQSQRVSFFLFLTSFQRDAARVSPIALAHRSDNSGTSMLHPVHSLVQSVVFPHPDGNCQLPYSVGPPQLGGVASLVRKLLIGVVRTFVGQPTGMVMMRQVSHACPRETRADTKKRAKKEKGLTGETKDCGTSGGLTDKGATRFAHNVNMQSSVMCTRLSTIRDRFVDSRHLGNSHMTVCVG